MFQKEDEFLEEVGRKTINTTCWEWVVWQMSYRRLLAAGVQLTDRRSAELFNGEYLSR